MKKVLTSLGATVLAVAMLLTASAATQYTVVKGDSMWKIAVRHQIGLSEIISANPHVDNPAFIYPGQQLTIPSIETGVLGFEEQVISLVNAERAKAGLKSLKTNWELSRIARYKSQDMADKRYFNHQSPTYGSPFDMIKSFGISYRSAGENIAKGQRTPQQVVTAWMNSPGHRANILGTSFTEIGVGYVESGHHWTQLFIGR